MILRLGFRALPRVVFFLVLGISTLLAIPQAFASEDRWLCRESGSERRGAGFLLCGLGEESGESAAREAALRSALRELDALCARSADCRDFETTLSPLRSDCRTVEGRFKCYRAFQVDITDRKRREPFVAGRSLREEVQRIEGVGKSSCPIDTSEFFKALLDLSTPESRERMGLEAAKVPYTAACLPAHERLMRVLQRHRVVIPGYASFLVQSFKEIEEVGKDERASLALEFLQFFGPLSDEQWASAFELVGRAGAGHFPLLVPRLFALSASSKEERLREQSRVDRVVTALAEGKLGRPVPLRASQVFVPFFRALEPRRLEGDRWLVLYALGKHRKALAPEKAAPAFEFYTGLRGRLSEASDREQVLSWMAELVQDSTVEAGLSRIVEAFLRKSVEEIATLRQEEAGDDVRSARQLARAQRELELFLERTRPILGRHFPEPEKEWERKVRAQLCIRFDLPCGSWMPDEGLLKKMLLSKRESNRSEALTYLAQNPKWAARFEAEILGSVKDADEGGLESGSVSSLLREALPAVAEIPNPQRETLAALLKVARRQRSGIQALHPVHGTRLEGVYVEELKAARDHEAIISLLDLGMLRRLAPSTCEAIRQRFRAAGGDKSRFASGFESALHLCR
jgi:hypothetical protein